MKKLQIISAIALTIAFAGLSQAAVVGSSSTSFVTVGESNVNHPPHTPGLAGIEIPATLGLGIVDFAGLTQYGTIDSNGIYTLSFPYTGAPKSHQDLGVFNFAQVGTADVWFGEWSPSGTVNDTQRSVYYVGSNADTAVPNSGVAKYSVTATNNYYLSGNDLLTGTLTADFGAAQLTGSMTNSLYGINIGTTTINSDASVTGAGTATATMLGFIPLASGGNVSAQFYNGQVDLAGMVDFNGKLLDTAFGGTRD
ncbi:MAG: hypothetical protein OFPII_22950 [Osedax symbiont Rs1]|nr:MAG: hypothetical protein OFPII_22950 [Osedax symbiont Rs1]